MSSSKIKSDNSSSASDPLRGFKVLPIQLHPDDDNNNNNNEEKSSDISNARFIYYKQHAKKQKLNSDAENDENYEDNEEFPADRTLFAINIPPFYNESNCSDLFQCFGDVDSVIFLANLHSVTTNNNNTKTTSSINSARNPFPNRVYYRSAYIIFSESSSMKRAISLDLSSTVQSYVQTDNINYGLLKYRADYKSLHPQLSNLQLQVDQFMELFDTRNATERAAAKSGAVVDSDGFILVKKRKINLLQVEQEQRTAKEKDETKNKKLKSKTTVNFYKFQERAEKQQRLEELRKKFEADKLKIQQMKSERKFKPY